MGIYADRVLPRIVDVACGTRGLDHWRDRVCEGLAGTVVEVGFGSGLNVPHYPSAVARVHAVEPSAKAFALARRRMARSSVAVGHAGLDGETIDLAASSCDSALVTFSLCTIPDPAQALSEIFRVLSRGGCLHFLEHGRSPEASVSRRQARIDPWQGRVAGGCHLTREPIELITAAGFEMLWSEERYARGPKPWSYFSVGVARKPYGASA